RISSRLPECDAVSAASCFGTSAVGECVSGSSAMFIAPQRAPCVYVALGARGTGGRLLTSRWCQGRRRLHGSTCPTGRGPRALPADGEAIARSPEPGGGAAPPFGTARREKMLGRRETCRYERRNRRSRPPGCARGGSRDARRVRGGHALWPC